MKKFKLSRRDFLRLQVAGLSGMVLGQAGLPARALGGNQAKQTTRVLALGLDGMDPQIVARMMKEGRLPTFVRVARQGCFSALRTSNPPQSPVAWSSFITGSNPGVHGIFDFIHRDPRNYRPYLSTSRTTPATHTVELGKYIIPLSSGGVENLRHGQALWQILAEHDVPATVCKIPANFPPAAEKQRTLSGMGTPDILGTYGIYTFFTEHPGNLPAHPGGGRIEKVTLRNHRMRASLTGPRNTYLHDKPRSRVEFSLYRDPVYPTAKIAVQGRETFLVQGEWSPWVRLTFAMAPLVEVHGICRFYLKRVHPGLELYVTPIHIDPADPAMPISSPEAYSRELYERLGPFHTKGLPADTKALDQGVLDDGEFLAEDELFLQEKLALFEYELGRFEAGLFFFYISHTDQRSHMFWRLRDPSHPMYDESLAGRYGDTIERTYQAMDRLLERALSKVDDHTLLLVFSDHGFAPFKRSFNLNRWLQQNGYLKLHYGTPRVGRLHDIDWSDTRAYAVGFNGLYLNLHGREGEGIVPAEQKRALAEEIATRLERVRDPQTGEPPILRADPAHRIYRGPQAEAGPDVIVGYSSGYRASWETALGRTPADLLAVNRKKWSGDHCLCPDVVPGILLANRPLRLRRGAGLEDLTATILAALRVPVPEDMDGRSLL